MRGNTNWVNTQETCEGAFDRPPAGGYVIKIVDAVDTDNPYDPAKPFIKVSFDIANDSNGNTEYQGFYTNRYNDSNGNLPFPHFRRYYMGKSAGFFKHFLSIVQKSNPGRFTVAGFNNDERKLKGMCIGVTLGYRQYKSTDNNGKEVIRETVQVVDLLSFEDVMSGNFKIPELQLLKDNAQPATGSSSFGAAFGGNEIPF